MGQRKTTPANRERILDAAARIVREHGVDNTTLADIADAAQISKGTLYYYYPTKGDLVFDIAERHMRNMTSRIFTWMESNREGQGPKTVLRMVLDTVMHSRSRGRMHLYLIQEAMNENPTLQARFVTEYREWHRLIEKGLARIYGDGEFAAVGRVLLAALDGLVLQRLIGVEGGSSDEVASFFADALSALRAVRTSGAE